MPTDPAQIAALHRDAPLTDIHVHPSLKAYLFRRNLWRHYGSGSTFNPFSSRSDFTMLEAGGVGVIWAAHYFPERELFRQCLAMTLAGLIAVPVYARLMTGDRLLRLFEMMDALEREVARRPDRVELARSAADVTRIRAAGRMAVVHTVEGAHVLEGDAAKLDLLAARGVAMITLCHFFQNGIAAQTRGIPTSNLVNRVCPYDFSWSANVPLTDYGRDVLRGMARLGMLVDVTHCAPAARQAVLAEVGQRPVVASHVGVQGVNPDPYNLADEEIRAIAAGGGLIGVIFMTYWLHPDGPKHGLDAIWRTLEHIHTVCGSFDHVALGTDFDGFTDPPDDVEDASRMGAVTAMLLDRGVPDADVRKILGGNARRVLERGWGT
ncbi:MAG TPA: membrane dipeptidase [Gemmatimonadales bacterium]|jgi:microsomal dipeptidase-like Zn-dependent dipeptidase